MSDIVCDSSNFEEVISASLQEFSDDTIHEIKDIITDKSKELAKNIKRDSPRRKTNGGKYAKGWTATKEYENNLNISYVVHNKKEPYLTHLLENGHMNKDGSRTEGIPHIEPNCETIQKEIDEEIERRTGS